MPAQSAQKRSKGGKGSPKLGRSARARQKYAAQYVQTWRNKCRRVKRCNGPEALAAYIAAFAVIKGGKAK